MMTQAERNEIAEEIAAAALVVCHGSPSEQFYLLLAALVAMCADHVGCSALLGIAIRALESSKRAIDELHARRSETPRDN